MDPFSKYEKDFRRLVNAVCETYDGHPPVEERRDIRGVINASFKLARASGNAFSIEREDVEQELRLMWIRFSESYRRNNVSISLRQYLIRRSSWELRDWLTKLFHTPRRPSLPLSHEENEPEIKLDLSFLLYGETWPPLAALSAHQRYLIYLKFVEDKDILHIAKHLKKDRHTVSSQFSETMDLIRRMANE